MIGAVLVLNEDGTLKNWSIIADCESEQSIVEELIEWVKARDAREEDKRTSKEVLQMPKINLKKLRKEAVRRFDREVEMRKKKRSGRNRRGLRNANG